MSPLLALFLVAAVGYLAGKIEVRGVSLGVAGVLFAGLALSALVEGIEVPEVVPQLGLVLFIYAIGIASGPGFFASFQKRGVRDGAAAVLLVALAATLSVVLGRLVGASGGTIAGTFAGALTNTPALAAVVEALHRSGGDADAPVVAYSLAYPLGVLGLLAAMLFADVVAPANAARPSQLDLSSEGLRLETATLRIGAAAAGKTPAALKAAHHLKVAFGRHRRGTALAVADEDAPLVEGDLLSVIGERAACDVAVAALGEPSEEHLELDRRVLDFRRISVSRPELAQKPLRELELHRRFGATITRIRRGDVELLPDESTELELGDRVRVIAPRERMDELSRFFGDSVRALAEIDTLTFGLGIVLGLLVGQIAVPLPGGGAFRLGIAGGPLVVALVLGNLGRTGPLTWSLPYAASLTLRQVGLLLFLGGIGLRSGHAFAETLGRGEGLGTIGIGAAITVTSALVTLLVATRVLRLPVAVALGVVSGIHTQPAALAFAGERTKSELPRVGYASVFPLATVAKIVIAQLIVGWL